MNLFLGPGRFLVVPYKMKKGRTLWRIGQLKVPVGYWWDSEPGKYPRIVRKATYMEIAERYLNPPK